MLKSAAIKNFILITDYYLEFSKGLYSITGTTGAGKSIIIDAILFGLGYKINKDIIKPGAEKASIVLEFSVSDKIKNILAEQDIEIDDILVIKAVQNQNSKRKFYINNEIVTQKIINQLAEELIEIHGQKSGAMMLKDGSQTEIIDHYGNLVEIRQKLTSIFQVWQHNIRKKEKIDQQKKYIEQEIDFLDHVIKELAELDILVGEEEELDQKRKDLKSIEQNSKLISDSINRLEHAEVERILLTIQKSLMRENNNAGFDNVINHLDQAMILIDDVKQELSAKLLNVGEVDLEEVEARLFAIRAIARKHGKHSNELPAYLTELQDKYQELSKSVSDYGQLIKEIEQNKKEYLYLANDLSQMRQKVAIELAAKVMQEIKPLKMEMAKFVIDIITIDNEQNYKSDGIDQINFMVTTNPGMPLAPMNKIASGGELSRFVLAMRVALFDKYGKDTIIFDEVDTGIGGEIASAVGSRLKVLGKVGQVITITHQPQVASFADYHMIVVKQYAQDETESRIFVADKAAREDEIARMLSSEKITDLSRKAAAEMIEHAQNQ